jgi:hypothetical protein
MKLTNLHLRILFIFLIHLNSPPNFTAQALNISEEESGNSIRIEPFLTYRQASLDLRKDSSLFDSAKDRDFVDQFYLTTKLTKEWASGDIAAIEPAFFSFRDRPSETSFRIDQAYFELKLTDAIKLITGKRVELRGAGFFFSPSDLINENRSIIDPLNGREGKHMTRVELGWLGGKFAAGYVPEPAQPWRAGKLWLLSETSLFDSDLGLQITHNAERKLSFGYWGSRFFGEIFEFHVDGRYQQRLNAKTSAADREFSSIPDQSSANYYLAGSRIVFNSSASLVLEYIKNSAGLSESDLHAFFQAQQARRDQEQTPADPFEYLVSREYASASFYDDKLTEKLRTSISVVHNLRDRSSFATINAKYKVASLLSLNYAPLFFLGSSRTEFGENPVRTAHYLTAEAIF